MTIDYICRNDECEHEFEIRYYPETPSTGMSGPWEHSEQGEAAYTDPNECPKCGEEVDVDYVTDFYRD